MKPRNNILSALVCTVLMLLAATRLSAVTPRTVLNDLNSKIETCIDYDGVYGSQCVDLVKYVLGEYFGHTIVGNANDYVNLGKFPAGTQKILYHDSFIAQPCDIFVFLTRVDNGTCWGLVSGVCYGHTGVIESGDEVNVKTMETNAGGTCPGGGGPLRKFTRANGNIHCVMRLPWTYPEAIVTSVTPVNHITLAPKKDPLTIKFSHKMNRASVESAISLAPMGFLTYSWADDYTLNVNISKLEDETFYRLTINGSIAKNSETNALFDGDKDGAPGGNYLLRFTTDVTDETPPTVVSYDPVNGSQPEQLRPIVRIGFSEPLKEATIASNQITVTDHTGAPVSGVQQYTAVNRNASALHYLFTSDLKAGETYTVTMKKDGLMDLYSNAIDLADDLRFSFTPRPREVTDVAVIESFTNLTAWPTYLTPASGVNTGINSDVTKPSLAYIAATVERSKSMKLTYQWTAADGIIRMNKMSPYTPKFAKNANNTIQLYLFGDGSGSKVRITVRVDNTGTIWSCKPITVDWIGWRLIRWNPSTDPGEAWLDSGTGIADGTNVNFNAIGMHPSDNFSYSSSFLIFDDIKVVKIGNYIDTGIDNLQTPISMKVSVKDNSIYISSENIIEKVVIYSLTGTRMKSVKPELTFCEIAIDDLAKGVYILKAGNFRKKFVKE